MPVTIEDIFKKIDELDTFLIEAGCERVNEIELVSYFTNSSLEQSKVTMTVDAPEYGMKEDDND
jgi:hypothetical protein